MKKQFLLLFLASLCLTSASGQVVTDGLIGYWPFNGNANDESSNTNDGSVHGASLINDRHGNADAAYSFNGTDNYIDCGKDASLQISTFSINFWFKYSDTSKIQVFVNNANSNDGEWGFQCYHHSASDAGLVAGVAAGSNDAWLASSSQENGRFADDEWHMYTATYSAKTNKLNSYVDGKFINGITSERHGFRNGIDSLQHTGNDAFIMGAHSQYFSSTINAGPRYLEGALDDFYMFNRVIDSAEIQKLYGEKTASVTNNLTSDVTYIKVYPNPAKSLLYIESIKPEYIGNVVQIMDQSGRVLISVTLTEMNQKININTLSKGVYFLTILDENKGKRIVKKVLVE